MSMARKTLVASFYSEDSAKRFAKRLESDGIPSECVSVENRAYVSHLPPCHEIRVKDVDQNRRAKGIFRDEFMNEWMREAFGSGSLAASQS